MSTKSPILEIEEALNAFRGAYLPNKIRCSPDYYKKLLADAEVQTTSQMFATNYAGSHNRHLAYVGLGSFEVVEDESLTTGFAIDPPTQLRPSWDEYFMEVAHAIAKRSTCLRVPDGVGCVIASSAHTIIATGYAGSVRGQPHCIDVGCLMDEQTGGCVRTVHAEQNAILHARTTDIIGATAYTTMSPCWRCMLLLVQSGVRRVVYAKEYRLGVDRQRMLAEGAEVELQHMPWGAA